MTDVIDLLSSSPPLPVAPKSRTHHPNLGIGSTKTPRTTASNGNLSSKNKDQDDEDSEFENVSPSLFIYGDTPQGVVVTKKRRLSPRLSGSFQSSSSPAPLPPAIPQREQLEQESAALLSVTAKSATTIAENGRSAVVDVVPSLTGAGPHAAGEHLPQEQEKATAAGGKQSEFLNSLSFMLDHEDFDLISSSSPFRSNANGNGTKDSKTGTIMTTNVAGSTIVSGKRRYEWDGEMSDPIVFTSSAPEPTTSRNNKSSANSKEVPAKTTSSRIITIDSDGLDSGGDGDFDSGLGKDIPRYEGFGEPYNLSDDVLDDLMGKTRRASKLQSHLSGRTSALLASLTSREAPPAALDDAGNSATAAHPRQKNVTRRKVSDGSNDNDSEESPCEPQKASKPNRRSKLTAEEREAKAKEREVEKAERTRAKEEEKQRKRLDKEAKEKEKKMAAEIAEVNKVRDKKISTRDMIVDLASSFIDTNIGHLTTQYMQELKVETSFFESTIPNVIKWRRKVRATYDEEAREWRPCALHISLEKHVLCLLTAQEFVDMVIRQRAEFELDNPETLELHVLRMRSAHPSCKIIYMIEGLAKWKRQNSRNKVYQAEVRRQIEMNGLNGGPCESAPSNQSRRKKAPSKKPEDQPPVDPDLIEDALLQLQVSHECLIQHTNTSGESAEWIKIFTEHVSTIPYREERMNMNDAGFCMDKGQVRCGENAADTFVKMLEEVNRITAPIAYGIAAVYPSVTDLLRGMKAHGPGMLEDVRKSVDRNGALSDSRIGPAVSRRLYKVFMGEDPTSTDI